MAAREKCDETKGEWCIPGETPSAVMPTSGKAPDVGHPNFVTAKRRLEIGPTRHGKNVMKNGRRMGFGQDGGGRDAQHLEERQMCGTQIDFPATKPRYTVAEDRAYPLVRWTWTPFLSGQSRLGRVFLLFSGPPAAQPKGACTQRYSCLRCLYVRDESRCFQVAGAGAGASS